MNKLTKENKIENMIYEIRGREVMLDSDLARLYECKNGTKEINQAVKNNPNKFPERFTFKISKEESQIFLVKIFDQKKETRGGKYNMPRVFTEEGVLMLATILKSKVAASTTIAIMDAFVAMRKYISSSIIEQKYINNLVLEDHEKVKLLQESINEMNEKEKVNTLFFEGQIYDAYSLLRNIFEKANKEIIIIDNYIDRHLLNVLKDTNKKIIIYTNKYNNEDYLKYKKEYSNVKLIINNKFHDRFIILDKNILYHSGASFKDLGSKCFAISKIDDKDMLNSLLKHIDGGKVHE